MENVRVELDPSDGYSIAREVPIPKLSYGETGSNYIVLKFPTDIASTVSSFSATLKFTAKDCDPTTGVPDSDVGYEDDYLVSSLMPPKITPQFFFSFKIEDIEVGVADQMQKVAKANFNLAWEEATELAEVENTYVLSSVRTLEDAVTSIISFLGMAVADKSDKIPEGKSSHTLFLSGRLLFIFFWELVADQVNFRCLPWGSPSVGSVQIGGF